MYGMVLDTYLGRIGLEIRVILVYGRIGVDDLGSIKDKLSR